jgi:predicted phosphoribosyltransferase
VDRRDVFADRADAGRRLGASLAELGLEDPIVAGIPRGGIVVAVEVAAVLGAPVRAVVARKVGAPGHAELALGAVGPDGVAVLDPDLVRRVGASEAYLERAVAAARAEVEARVASLPKVLTRAAAADRTVVAVDDGVATGATAAAVGRWLGARTSLGSERALDDSRSRPSPDPPARRVLALPVGPPDTLARLGAEYELVFALLTPPGFVAVGQWYRDFRQVSDEEVARLLA